MRWRSHGVPAGGAARRPAAARSLVVALGTAVVLYAGVIGRSAQAGPAVQAPPAGAGVSYQIGGQFPPAAGVQIVDRDRHEAPAPARYGICYVNAFQAQPDEVPWWLAHHPDLLLRRGARLVIDRAWNEPLLDTSTASRRSRMSAIVGRWMAGCARAGYRAVELDNLDSYARSQGSLSRAGNMEFAGVLVARAHAAGLAAGQKNASELVTAARREGFDFAVTEECQAYRECDAFTRSYGREVIEVEYPDNGGVAGFTAACRARGRSISVVLRDRAVTPYGRPGFLERRCR